MFVFN